MWTRLAQRLVGLIFSLLVILTLTFLLLRAVPGGIYRSERSLSAPVRARVEESLGLDLPLPAQYWRFISRYLKGDFGWCQNQDRTVNEKIALNAPVSAFIGVAALLLALAAGIPLGVLAAARHDRWPDHAARGAVLAGICLPAFVLGPLLVLVFASWLDWAEPGLWRWGSLRHCALPVLTLAALPAAYIARITRTGMLEALNQDYVRTARAKGLGEGKVVFKHALRNGVLSVVSYLGPAAAALVTGSIVVESVFALPGLGREFVIAATGQDTTLVAGLVILYSTILISFNFFTDVAYTFIDPRVKL